MKKLFLVSLVAIFTSSCAQNKAPENGDFLELEMNMYKFNLHIYDIEYGGFLESKNAGEVESKVSSVDRSGNISDVVNDIASDLDVSVEGYTGGVSYFVKKNHALSGKIESMNFAVQEEFLKKEIKSSSLKESFSILLKTGDITKDSTDYSISFSSDSFLSKLNAYKPVKRFTFDSKGSLEFGEVEVEFNDLGNSRGQIVIYNFEKPQLVKEKITLD